MRVLVCGGRDYNNYLRVREVLDEIFFDEGGYRKQKDGNVDIIEGGATGADALARQYGTVEGIQVIEMPANWGAFGKSAGYIRNQNMLEMKPDKVVAFPGGKGTANMVKIAKEAGVEVREIPND